MRATNLLASKVPAVVLCGAALAASACGDDGSATSSGNGSGGDATASTGNGQGGDGKGGDPSGSTSSSTSSSSPTTGTQSSGGGEGGGPSGPGNGGAGGTGGETTAGGGDPGSGGQGGVGGDEPPPCSAGTILCDGTTQQICDGEGGVTETECAPGGCIPGLGCTVCQPGTAFCNGNVSNVCNGAGSGYDVYVCDPVQGSVCDAGTGHCTGTCSPEVLGESYIGCDYYPTVTVNSQLQNTFISGEGTYAVAVANTTDEVASVQVDRGGAIVSTTTVAAGSVQIIPLPWIYELKNAAASVAQVDGAYHLRTTQPVTVYQYNPIEYSTLNGNTYTNDASLLFPTNAWTGSYRVASRNSWYAPQAFISLPGFYAVVASQDATTVTLAPSATGGSILAGGGLPGNGAGTVVLNQGDVLQVLSASSFFNVDPIDLTGTGVFADKPVQVISGHDCTNIPFDVGYCDHLEESMPPLETLSTEYIVTPPESAAGGADSEWIRIIATEAGTNLTYDPAVGGAGVFLANPGDYIEIPNNAQSFVVTGDRPILVSQYLRGQGDSGIPGDPGMALAVATEQYRDEYLFHAPTNYLSNFVNITAPTGASIVLDGVPVGGFVQIGASDYSVARVPLSNAGDGNHEVSGSEPFGISVYGYGDDTSYWYPGGLDLEQVN